MGSGASQVIGYGVELVGLFACHEINAWITKRVSIYDQRLIFSICKMSLWFVN